MDKFKNNQPPTEDCMDKWRTLKRVESQKSEYLKKRLSQVREKESLSTEIPLRRAPPKRFNEYEDDKTGLKKSYGRYAPFAVYPNPPNMRHLKYPKSTIKNNVNHNELNNLQF